ncbi:MAG: nucleotidyltransferase family protein [Gammaproteobacteria bacterium]|nr:nucleotidyltransferase family protein [Gammaproteobacteria bacterium]
MNKQHLTIGAVILAAGLGQRIGTPKWKLPIGDTSFLKRLVQILKQTNVAPIYAVVRPSSIPPTSVCHTVINHHYEEGPLSSMALGIRAISKADGILLIPVDHPCIQPRTINALKTAFLKHPNCVIRPCYKQKIGHPILLPYVLAQHVPEQDREGGLNRWLKENGALFHDVETHDLGILKNINTTLDLKQIEG